MAANENVTFIYNLLKKNGDTSAKDVNEFSSRMQGRGYRAQIYGFLKQRGVGNLGNGFGDFEKKVGYGTTNKTSKKSAAPKAESTKQATSVGAQNFGGGDASKGQVTDTMMQVMQNAQQMQNNRQSVPAQQSRTQQTKDYTKQSRVLNDSSQWDENGMHISTPQSKDDGSVERTNKMFTPRNQFEGLSSLGGRMGKEAQAPYVNLEHTEYATTPKHKQTESEKVLANIKRGTLERNKKVVDETLGNNKTLDKIIDSSIDAANLRFAKASEKDYNFGMPNMSPSGYDTRNATALQRANMEIDPDRVMKDVQDSLGKNLTTIINENMPQYKKAAKTEGISVEAYLDKYIYPHLQEEVQKKFDKAEIKQYLPKNAGEYIINGVRNSFVGTLINMGQTTQGQRQYQAMADQQVEEQLNQSLERDGSLANKARVYGLRGARGTVGFATDAAIFKGTNALAKGVIDGVLGSSARMLFGKEAGAGATSFITSNFGKAGRIMYGGANSSLGFGLYGGVNEVAQTLSNGDTSASNLGKAFLSGFEHDAVAGAAMGAVGGVMGEIGAKIGIKSGDSIGKAVLHGTEKAAFNGTSLLAEGFGMQLGEQLNSAIAGTGFNLTWDDTLENAVVAGMMKLTSPHVGVKDPNDKRTAMQRFVGNVYGFFSERPTSKFQLTKDEKNEILRITGCSSLDEVATKILPYGKSTGIASEQYVKDAQINYLTLMNSLSWDTQQKISVAMTGTAASARPRTDHFFHIGNNVIEYDKAGNVLSEHTFNTEAEKQAYITQKNINTENNDLMGTYGIAVMRNKNLVETILSVTAEAMDVKPIDIMKAMSKQPIRRSVREREILRRFEKNLHDFAFPENEVHIEQSEIDGGNAVKNSNILSDTPNVEEIQEINASVTASQQELLQTYKDYQWGKDYEDLKKQGLSDEEAYQRLVELYDEPELEPLAKAIDGQHKQIGILNEAQNEIESKISEVLSKATSGQRSVDGAAVDENSVTILHDEQGNEYILLTGDVTFKNGRGTSEQPIAYLVKENGEWVNHSGDAGQFVDYENRPREQFENDYFEELGLKAQNVIDPKGELNPANQQQGEGTGAEGSASAQQMRTEPEGVGTQEGAEPEGESVRPTDTNEVVAGNGEIPTPPTEAPQAPTVPNTPMVIDSAAPTTPAEGEKPSIIKKEWGESNKIVTKDKHDELIARLKKKMNQMSSGVDPELLEIGTELAMYHIEAGARKFGDFVRAMVRDLVDAGYGKDKIDALRGQFKRWYGGAIVDDDMAEYANDFDDAKAVRESSVEDVVSQLEQEVGGFEQYLHSNETKGGIPLDEEGNAMVTADGVKPVQAVQHIYNENGLSKEEADAYVDDMVKESNANYDKLKKKEPKLKGTLKERADAKRKHEEDLLKAKNEADRWQEIYDEAHKFDLPEKSAAEQKAEEADADRDIAEAMAGFEDDPTMIICANMPKITPEAYYKETGLSAKDRPAFWLASKAKGGMSVDEAVISLRELFENNANISEDFIRNTVIDIISHGGPRSYAKLLREDFERQQRYAEEAYNENQKEAWAQENFHMSAEEWDEYEEIQRELLREQYQGVDLDELAKVHAEMWQEYDSAVAEQQRTEQKGGEAVPQRTEQKPNTAEHINEINNGRENEGTDRGNEVLSEEQTGKTGGTAEGTESAGETGLGNKVQGANGRTPEAAEGDEPVKDAQHKEWEQYGYEDIMRTVKNGREYSREELEKGIKESEDYIKKLRAGKTDSENPERDATMHEGWIRAYKELLSKLDTKEKPNTAETKGKAEPNTAQPKTKKTLAQMERETEEEHNAYEKEVPKMSDEELLDSIREQGADITKAMHTSVYDEYDSRHNDEYLSAYDVVWDSLAHEGTSVEDAEEMLASSEKAFADGGFADDSRATLMGQMDALREYIDEQNANKPNEEVEPVDDVTKPFYDRIDGEDKLTNEDVDKLNPEEYNTFLKTQLKAAIKKIEDGQPLGAIEQGIYLKALKDVRTTREGSAENSTDADNTQLAGGDNVESSVGGEGRPVGDVDREGGRKTPEGQPGGSNNKGSVSSTAGEGSNKPVRDAESTNGRLPANSGERGGSSRTGSKGSDVRKSEGSKPVSRPSKDAARDEIQSHLKDSKARVADALARLKKPKQPKNDKTFSAIGPASALGLWIAKQGEKVDWKALGDFSQAITDVGIDYIRLGAHDFGKWKSQLLADFKEALKDVFDWGDSEVEDYIREMWNSDYEIDGETHTVGKWASIIGDKELRKEISRSLDEKREEQRKAESVAVKVGDRDNIDETLPYLLPEQRDDVFKAETQFFDPSHQNRTHGNGKGMMFTNGTGTGKTYTGLGIVKRFVKQGKKRVLIVTPSQTKVSDWIKDGGNLGLDIKALESTKDAGEGVVCTTYANLRANEAILRETFDLIMYDESHKIMENKQAEETVGTQVHYQLTNKDKDHAVSRIKMKHEPFVRERDLNNEYRDTKDIILQGALDKLDRLHWGIKGHNDQQLLEQAEQLVTRLEGIKEENRDDDWAEALNHAKIARNALRRLQEIPKEIEALRPAQKALMPEIEAEAEKAVKTTKTVFLSATPFNTRESLKYAEGYIFSYPEENQATKGTYNHRSPEQAFLEQHFSAGYRWRYGRLEHHVENPSALSRQEVQFSDYLQQQLGTLSTRQIQNGYDYSRTFPTVTLEKADEFNQALQDVSRDEELRPLGDAFRQVFYNYNKQTALFESMKTALVAERIKEHLARGRKVVVFHRRRTSTDTLTNPFKQALDLAKIQASQARSKEQKAEIEKAITAFENRYADLLEWEQTLDYRLPRAQLAGIFGEENVAFFSGEETKKEKQQSVDDFIKDNDGKDIIVIQEASGKEGISLQDTTGKHQRAQISLCLPQSPIAFIQSEGRIFRIGQKSNAIFEYPLLGLDLEINLWAQKFNSSLGTTENLAMGNKARNLSESIARGVLENSGFIGYNDAGVGGREYDGNIEEAAATGFDGAIQDYFTNQKINSKRDNREGKDYFPTPEPLGYKMVEWGLLGEGESVLEPSAGHGAIARYVPKDYRLTMIEPSNSLMSKLMLNTPGSGRTYNDGDFESYDIHNKHDVVVMNPPYGVGGTTAVEHVAKAFQHLNEGGRVIAIIPSGPACDKKMDRWLNGEQGKAAVVTGEVLLPSCTFGRAGTSVSTRIVIIDKVTRAEARKGMPQKKTVDLRGIDDVQTLFDEVRDIDMPRRTIDKVYLRGKTVKNTVRKLHDEDSAYHFVLNGFGGNEDFFHLEFKGRNAPIIHLDIEKISNGGFGALNAYNTLKERKESLQEWRYDKTYTMGRGSNKITVRQIDIMRDVYDQAMEMVAKVAGTTVDKLDRELAERNSPHTPSKDEMAEADKFFDDLSNGVIPGENERWEYKTVKHSKTGEDLHIVTSKEHMSDDEYKKQSAKAKSLGGFWDRYSKGFRFPDKESAEKFMEEGNKSVNTTLYRGDLQTTDSTNVNRQTVMVEDEEGNKIPLSILPMKSGVHKVNGQEVNYEGLTERIERLRKERNELYQKEYNSGAELDGRRNDGPNRLDEVERELSDAESELTLRNHNKEKICRKYHVGDDGTITLENLRTMLTDYVKQGGVDKNVVKIFDEITEKIAEFNIKYKLSNDFDDVEEKYHGFIGGAAYKNKVTIYNLDYLSTEARSAADYANTILHEQIHHLTSSVLDAYKKDPNSLSKRDRQVAEKLEDILKTIWEARDRGEVRDSHSIENIKELVSDIFNPQFREEIKDVKYKDKSVVRAFVDTVRDWFCDTVLSKLINNADRFKSKEAKTAIESVEEVFNYFLKEYNPKYARKDVGSIDTSEPEFHKIEATDKDLSEDDKKAIKELNEGKTKTVYRAMQVIDGKLYPPMAAKIGGELVEGAKKGDILKADEHPEYVTITNRGVAYRNAKGQLKYRGSGQHPASEMIQGKDGKNYWKEEKPENEVLMDKDFPDEIAYKFILDKGSKDATGKKATDIPARYNPYWHTSNSPMNDQFKSAWIRPNMVVVECEIPESELTSGYKAQYAKDAVGMVPWKSGSVTGALVAQGHPGREVYLSRYCKIGDTLSDAEAAKMMKEFIGDKNVEIPENVVTPKQRVELEKLGVKIGAPEKGVKKSEQIAEALEKGLSVDNTLRASEMLEGDKPYTATEPNTAVRKYVDSINADGKIGVHDDIKDVPEKYRKGAERGTFRGWYDEKDGSVHLYMPNIHSKYEANKVIVHESVGHKGLREVLNTKENPNGYQKFMDGVWADKSNKELHDFVNKYMPTHKWDMYEAIDEWLAREAEKDITPEKLGFWGKITAALNKALVKIGIRDASLNINDVRMALWLSKNRGNNPNDPLYKARAAAMRDKLAHEDYTPAVKDGKYVDGGRHTATNEVGKERDSQGATNTTRASERLDDDNLTPMGKAIRDRYDSQLKTKKFRYREAFHDRMESLRRLQELIVGKGKEVADSMNAYLAENHITSIAEAQWNKFRVQKFQPVEEAINKCVGLLGGKASEAKNEIETYLYKKHGLERNRYKFVEKALANYAKSQACREAEKNYRYMKQNELSPEDMADMGRENLNTADKVFSDYKENEAKLYRMYRNGEINYNDYLKGIDEWINGNLTGEVMFNDEDVAKVEALQAKALKIYSEIGKIEAKESKTAEDTASVEELKGKIDNIHKELEKIARAYDYDPNKNDYSGISAFDEGRTLRGRSVEYDEQSIIDAVDKMEGRLGKSNVDNIQKTIKEATDFSVDYTYNSGQADSQTRDAVKGMYHFYVPLRGFAEDKMEDIYENRYGNDGGNHNVGKVIKRADGRLSLADSPLATISAMANSAINYGERNKMLQKFYRLVLKNPNDAVKVSEMWEYDKNYKGDEEGNGGATSRNVEDWQLAMPEIPLEADGNETTDGKAIADAVESFNKRMQELEKKGAARKVLGRPKYPEGFLNNVHSKDHAVRLYINGREKWMWVTGDPRAAQALRGEIINDSDKQTVNITDIPGIGGVYKKLTKIVTGEEKKTLMESTASLATSYSPEFILSNLERDTFFSNANIASKEDFAYWKKFSKNQAICAKLMLTSGIGGDRLNGESLFEKYYRGRQPNTAVEQMFFDFMDNGGRTGFVAQQQLEAHKRALSAAIKSSGKKAELGRALAEIGKLIPNGIEEMNMRAELVNRFATYMTSRQMGRSKLRSVADAKEVSVNFNRHGAGNATEGSIGTWAGVMRNNFMFFNAGMQSVELLYRNLSKDKSTAIKALTYLGGIPAMVGTAFAMWMASQDDEEYSKIPSWDRRNNICIPIKDKGYVKLALPIELRAFWGMGDVIASLSNPRLRTDEGAAFAMAGQITQALPLDILEAGERRITEPSGYIPLLPTSLRPLAEYLVNKDWTGKQIERDSKFNPNAPYWTRAYSSVPKPMVELCKWAHDKLREGKETSQETDVTGNSVALDPSMYNHILKSYFSGLYSLTFKIVGATTADEFDPAHLPMLSRVWGSFSDKEADQTTNAKYYMYKREADDTNKEYSNKANKSNPLAITELDRSGRGRRAQIFKKADKDIQKLQKKIDKSTDKDEIKSLKRKQAELKRDLADALDKIE